MDDGTEQKRSTAALFDEQAAAYLDSRVHRVGDDLDQLVEWVGAADRALDVATGAGHTAGALAEGGANQVVAADAAPTMVATATQAFPGDIGVICDAERLPFATNSFDAVTCRIAAHHFPEPTDFVAEVARVLKPGGTLAFEDNVAPDDEVLDDFLNRVERIRDPTHVRSHRVGDWLRWFETAGLTVEASRVVTKTLDYDEWVANVDLSTERRKRLEAAFADRPPEATEAFEITDTDDGIESFANLKLLVRATR
ncbi:MULTISPECIES: class I SAM-dependent methyltransferase [Halobacterium]|uniref:class I SAM-dependent methyltransferase n=1 Tax=Halobacterium TaxID=2239 RepID=UPI00073E8319|nr:MULTISPECIES: class I SAM-dependent methyltransferase [Halobacterium]MCG1004783.1 class I SAM-dependent methyltransferase [Halobacterium noricense]